MTDLFSRISRLIEDGEIYSRKGWYYSLEDIYNILSAEEAITYEDLELAIQKIPEFRFNPRYHDEESGETFPAIKIQAPKLEPVFISEEDKEAYREAIIERLLRSPYFNSGTIQVTELGAIVKAAGIDRKRLGYEFEALLEELFRDRIEIDDSRKPALVKFNDYLDVSGPSQPEHHFHYNSSHNDSIYYQEFDGENTFSEPSTTSYKYNENNYEPGNFDNTKIFDLGYVTDDKFKLLCELTGIEELSIKDVQDSIIAPPQYLNGAGFPQFKDGTKIHRENGKYILLKTSYQHALTGEPIVGWFKKVWKDPNSSYYKGIYWGTERDFFKRISSFVVGRLIFRDQEKAFSFIDSLHRKAMTEPWAYRNPHYDNTLQFPILNSFVKGQFEQLLYEQEEKGATDAIIYNEDNTRLIFNSGLIDRFGNDIYITGEVEEYENRLHVGRPIFGTAPEDFERLGFDADNMPRPAHFFSSWFELFFNPQLRLEYDNELLERLLEERYKRVPMKYKMLSPWELSQKFDNAIRFALKLAIRNSSFVVAAYDSSAHSMKHLIPIYLDCVYNDRPDFVLAIKLENDKYVADRIIGIDEAYKDARLICRPFASWIINGITSGNNYNTHGIM